MNIGTNLHCKRGRKERAPPDVQPAKKKRTIVIYGDEEGDANALNSPLIPNDSKEVSQVLTPKVSVDLTKEDNDTAASTDTIPQLSQLTQNLAFLEKILMNL